jgi:hypothetical protein
MYSLSKSKANELLFTKCDASSQQSTSSVRQTVTPRPPSKRAYISFHEWHEAHADTIQDVMNVLTDALLSCNMSLSINTTKMYDMLAARMYATSYNKEKKQLILFSGP